MVRLGLFVVICALAQFCGAQVCSEPNIDNCMAHFNVSWVLRAETVVLPTWNLTELEDVCSAANVAMDCVMPFRRYCNLGQRLEMGGMEDKYFYICEENKTAYLSHRTCYANENLQAMMNVCVNTYVEEIARSVNYQQICSVLETFLHCIYNGTSSYCPDGADWAYEYSYREMVPLLDYITCKISPPEGSGISKGQCTLEKIEVCREVFGERGIPVAFNTSNELQTACAAYPQFINCTNQIKGSCTYTEKAAYVPVIDAFEFLCNDGFAGAVSHSVCVQGIVETATTHCWTEMSLVLCEPEDLECHCKKFEDTGNCLITSTLLGCGLEDAKWVTNYFCKSHAYDFEHYGCNTEYADITDLVDLCSAPQGCLEVEVDYCKNFLDDILLNENHGTVLPVLPYWNQETLDQICSSFGRFNSCIEPIREFCEPYTKLSLDGFRDALDYVCSEAKEVYLAHVSCFSGRESLQFEAVNCYKSFRDQMGAALSYATDAEICSMAEEYAYCMHRETDLYCGSEAAEWVFEYSIRDITSMLNQYFNCAISPPTAGDPNIPPDGCTLNKIDQCTKNLPDCLVFLANYHTREQLQALCKSYDNVKECITPIQSRCTPTEELQYQPLETFYSDICGSGLNAYLQYGQCVSQVKLTETCGEGAGINICGSEDHGCLCRETYNMIHCFEEAVKDHCEIDVQTWIIKVFDAVYAYPLHYYCSEAETEFPSAANHLVPNTMLELVVLGVLWISLR